VLVLTGLEASEEAAAVAIASVPTLLGEATPQNREGELLRRIRARRSAVGGGRCGRRLAGQPGLHAHAQTPQLITEARLRGAIHCLGAVRIVHRDRFLLARWQLAGQAQAEERRRIARDIHDLVGHGLAGVMLQVTSARHVLRRDIEAADEALAAAEAAGRRSLQELRGTVAVLRNASTSTLLLPSLAEVAALVDTARDDGLVVEYRSTGDVQSVSSAVGLALYRIAQEALLNAARHAPEAATVVVTAVTGRSVTLEVHSLGPLAARSEDGRPGYGLIGMRERAATVGGELEAGATSYGWRVCCRVSVTSP
jgi:signal transduction histidine kinase